MDQNQNQATAPAAAAKPKLTPVMTLLEEAIKTWWKNLAKFIGVYLWGLLYAIIPLVLAALLFGLQVWQAGNLNGAARISLTVIASLALVMAIYYAIRAYIGSFLLVKKGYEGREKDVFKETKNYFWPYLWLTILTTVFILLWSLLLIIPGIIASIFYSFAIYALFFDDKRGMKAIKRSVQLVKGYWWAIFGRLLVLGILVWIFSVIISLPVYFSQPDSWFYTVWNAIVQVISIIIGPISLLFCYRIYQDLVKIKK